MDGQWSYTDVDSADFEHLMKIVGQKSKPKRKILSLDGREEING